MMVLTLQLFSELAFREKTLAWPFQGRSYNSVILIGKYSLTDQASLTIQPLIILNITKWTAQTVHTSQALRVVHLMLMGGGGLSNNKVMYLVILEVECLAINWWHILLSHRYISWTQYFWTFVGLRNRHILWCPFPRLIAFYVNIECVTILGVKLNLTYLM